MNRSILIVVHPGYVVDKEVGYIAEKELILARYGNYNEYLSNLKNALYSRDSIVLSYTKDKSKIKLPFEFPNATDVIYDGDVNECEFISKLRDKKITKVDVCGELFGYCVRIVSGFLSKYFEVKIKRELCYPPADPK